MKRTLTRALTFVLVAALLQSAAPAQTPPPSAPAQTWPPAAPPTMRTPPDVDADDDDVVRITANLVQFDAVVTDKQGRQVTDLKAGDFDVLVDGKPRALTHLSYVSNLGAPTRPRACAPSRSGAPSPSSSEVDYGFHIYNAKVERAGGGARMQTQVRLFRDGRAVFDGQVMPFDGRPQNVAGDIGAGGQLRLGKEPGPGEYVLQLVVTALLAKEKYRVATQWIDFEIVE